MDASLLKDYVSSGIDAPRRRIDDRVIGLGVALLIGLNLRPAITSIAALLEQTGAWFGLSQVQLSVLATLPVIAFGVSAPIGPMLARRLGVRRALTWMLAALAMALVLRVLIPGGMLPGTFLAGVSIMAVGTLLPQYLKSLHAGGLSIGLSSMSFAAGAALGAGLTVPMSATAGGPPLALGIWAAPAVISVVAMIGVTLRPTASPASEYRVHIARQSRSVVALVTVIFGIQAMLFFAVTAWLPRLLGDRGVDAQTAGWLLATASIAGLVPTVIAPLLASRRRLLVWCGPGLGLVLLSGLIWLASGETSYLAITVLLGAVQSAVFGLSLGLMVALTADETSAGILSAIAQGIGYAFAGAGSLLVGILRDVTGSWSASLIFMMVSAIALSVVLGLVARCRPVTLHTNARAPISR